MSLLVEHVARCPVDNNSQNLGPTNRNNTEIQNNTERDQKSLNTCPLAGREKVDKYGWFSYLG